MTDTNHRRDRLSPTALSLKNAAQLLTKTGGDEVTMGMIQSDIDDCAPANADGTLNLVHYAAWLIKEMARGD